MSPSSAIPEHVPSGTNGTKAVPLEPGLSAKSVLEDERYSTFPKPPKFEDKHEERKYLKVRLAAAFRIFGKYGYDEGVAGHITVRCRGHASSSESTAFNQFIEILLIQPPSGSIRSALLSL